MMYYAEMERCFDHTLVWTTKDGRDIPIYNLPDDHLLNLERFLRFEGEQQPSPGAAIMWYPVIRREMYRRKLQPYAEL